MRLVLVVLLMPLAAWATTPSDDGFIWIDANTRIKVKPTAASGASAPEKAPEEPKKVKKERAKK